jgi:ADP-heptose:LPS heptosyltransferase
MPFEAQIKQALTQLFMGAEKIVRKDHAHTPEDLSRIRDFLFLQYNSKLSDCVHDTPIYEALRACRPDARITVATHGIGFETLRHSPFIDQLIATSDPHIEPAQTAWELRRELKRRRIRPAIGITSFSNAETNLALLNAIAGQHIRLGHTVLPGLYHLPQKYDHTMSLIHNNLCLVTIFHCPTGHVEPRVFFRDQDVAKVRDLLREKRHPQAGSAHPTYHSG